MKKLVVGLVLFSASLAHAQYPDKPIRFIVAQAAGSASDNIARMLAPEFSKALGQSLLIENRPGGAFIIGMEAIAKAPPDGYTIGLGVIGALTIAPHMTPKMPYDVPRDFQPVGRISSTSMMLGVAQDAPFKTIDELIAYAKANPGKLMNASSSTGSPGHLAGELFKLMTGTQIVHVPYKGGAAAINDLMAGHVQLMFESSMSLAPHARGGKVHALGVSSEKRMSIFPNVPAIGEVVKGYEINGWSGIIAPAGIPRPVLDKLNSALNTALATPSFRERNAQMADDPVLTTPEQFASFIRAEHAKWGDVVRRAGIRVD
jgi:tripartite-type tricarboxylate transporter receptor subunit TctC